MARSRRSRRSAKSSRARWIGWGVAGLVVVPILMGGVATILAKRYLRSDAFREFLASKVSRVLQVDGEFAPFSWTDASFYSDYFMGRGENAVQKVEAQGIRTTIDFSSFKREAWDVEEITINRVVLALGSSQSNQMIPPPALPSSRGFLARLIPQKVALKGIQIADFECQWRGEGGDAKASDLVVALTPMSGDDGWQLHVQNGELRLADYEPMHLERLHARLRPGEFFITDAGLEILNHASLTTAGDVNLERGQLTLRSRVDKLRGDRIWREDWKQRILGTLYADIKTEGRFGSETKLTHTGSVGLENGMLMALPVLEKLANHTKTERFRRLVLDKAEADFVLKEDRLWLENLLIQSDGLLRVEGSIQVDHAFSKAGSRPLIGVLEIGVVHDVLKWLPGAEKRVFTEGRSGFLWTTMRLGGTVEAPEEDLSPRLGKAAIEETIEAVPEAAIETSRTLLDTATGLLGPNAGSAIDDAGDQLIDQAEGVIQEGLRLVPMLDLGERPF